MSKSVAIIDYGMGNLHSVASAISHVNPEISIYIGHDPKEILAADRVIFPGVGAIGDCMKEIHALGLETVVRQVISSGTPILCICVGMQALMQYSEESNHTTGFGIFPAAVKRFTGPEFKTGKGHLKVPHMGWNNVKQSQNHAIWQNIADNSRFYFVHSYHVDLTDPQDMIGQCHYGAEFAAVFAKDNIIAAQFHPEKSGDVGLQFLQNFLQWQGN